MLFPFCSPLLYIFVHGDHFDLYLRICGALGTKDVGETSHEMFYSTNQDTVQHCGESSSPSGPETEASRVGDVSNLAALSPVACQIVWCM
jgi:hypothetical protein